MSPEAASVRERMKEVDDGEEDGVEGKKKTSRRRLQSAGKES